MTEEVIPRLRGSDPFVHIVSERGGAELAFEGRDERAGAAIAHFESHLGNAAACCEQPERVHQAHPATPLKEDNKVRTEPWSLVAKLYRDDTETHRLSRRAHTIIVSEACRVEGTRNLFEMVPFFLAGMTGLGEDPTQAMIQSSENWSSELSGGASEQNGAESPNRRTGSRTEEPGQ